MYLPGQKVVCVDDVFPPGILDIYNALPQKNKTYTVRDIVPGQSMNLQEQPAIYLEELHNLPNRHGIEPGFLCSRFRELDELPNQEIHANIEEFTFA